MARKVALAGYPLGFIIAPIYLYDGWEEGYATLVKRLAEAIPTWIHSNVSFELIQHRFTKPAKRVIEKHYPQTKLDLDETKPKMKWRRYGIYKYVYPNTEQDPIRELLGSLINTHFPKAVVSDRFICVWL